MNPNPESDMLKAHLGMCAAVLENIANQAGIDLANTKMIITINEQKAEMSIEKMIQKWKEISK